MLHYCIALLRYCSAVKRGEFDGSISEERESAGQDESRQDDGSGGQGTKLRLTATVTIREAIIYYFFGQNSISKCCECEHGLLLLLLCRIQAGAACASGAPTSGGGDVLVACHSRHSDNY